MRHRRRCRKRSGRLHELGRAFVRRRPLRIVRRHPLLIWTEQAPIRSAQSNGSISDVKECRAERRKRGFQ